MLRSSGSAVKGVIRCHGMPVKDIFPSKYFDGEMILSPEWQAFLGARAAKAAKVRANEKKRQAKKSNRRY